MDSDLTDPIRPSLDRRRALTIVGVAGGAAAGLAVLAACGGGSSAGASGSGSTSSSGSSGSNAGTTVAEADVAVGGGVIDGGVVVVQPTKGVFKAYSSRCPHQGCAVASVANNTIVCPCHGSTFDAATGDVTNGPATTGLTPMTATVSGDQVVVT